MSDKAPYKVEFVNPMINERCEIPFNDMSIASYYADRKREAGILNVRLWSEWNQGYIVAKKMKCVVI